MDPIIASIVVVLGKYALDKGEALLKEAGPIAVETVGKLYDAVMTRLRRDPKGGATADDFAHDPETYSKPLEKQIKAAAATDPAFAAALQNLAEQYDGAAAAYAAQHGTRYVSIVGRGGAAAQGEGATAVAQGGVNVGGDVGGPIITGSNVHVYMGSRAGGTAPPGADAAAPKDFREQIIRYFNDGEVRDMCYDLGVDYDSLPAEGKAGKVRELISHCERHGLTADLIAYVTKARPKVAWMGA